ncbi:uncharacterized protein [Nicotiana sylvestris]|uniref:uncharacterized protein n=1 Tax=Nicotiana sylvestris TaxID=4096 RepID=UPI00388CB035
MIEAVASDAVITGFVPIYYGDALVLFDLGSTYMYVSSYFSLYLDMSHDSLAIFYVSTVVGDSILVDRVYRACVVNIRGYEMRIDLLLHNMVDFDVILGMDWLFPYHAILDCHAKTKTLAMPRLSGLEWKVQLVIFLVREFLF